MTLASQSTKQCNTCDEIKPFSDFYRCAATRDGFANQCKQCRKAYARAHSAANRDAQRERHRNWSARTGQGVKRTLRRYKLSQQDYDDLVQSQDGKCAACGTEQGGGPRFVVDHDHDTGAVRGLLCYSCNTGIGLLGDCTEGVRAALRYLEAHASEGTDGPLPRRDLAPRPRYRD